MNNLVLIAALLAGQVIIFTAGWYAGRALKLHLVIM
jgi:hypothetical protein